MWNNLDDIPPEPPERSQSSKLLFKDYWTATHYSDWNDDHQDDLLIQKDQHFLGMSLLACKPVPLKRVNWCALSFFVFLKSVIILFGAK
jgi:hypothetical protein